MPPFMQEFIDSPRVRLHMTTYIGLLRGINVGGHNRIPMTELRALCLDLGWEGVQSYIQSGNLVFQADTPLAALETDLEHAIAKRFELSIPVLVRSASEWLAYITENPFPEESRDEPNRVMLALSKDPPKPDAMKLLQERAQHDERLRRVGNTLWIHYPHGAGTSKLSPNLFDRIIGSPVTVRNWRTVLNLGDMSRSL